MQGDAEGDRHSGDQPQPSDRGRGGLPGQQRTQTDQHDRSDHRVVVPSIDDPVGTRAVGHEQHRQRAQRDHSDEDDAERVAVST